MDVNEELKFLGKFKKKLRGGGGRGGCEQRSFCENSKKKILGGGVGEVGWGGGWGLGGRGSG